MSDFALLLNKFIPYLSPKDYSQVENESPLAEASAQDEEFILSANLEREAHYKNLKEHSWLRHSHPLKLKETEVDWTLLGLLAGDAFIAGTPIETRGNVSSAIAYLKDVFDSQQEMAPSYEISKLDRERIASFRTVLNDIEDVDNLYRKLRGELSDKSLDKKYRSSVLNEEAHELSLRYEKNGGWMPIGWVTAEGSSHAMMAHFGEDSLTLVLGANGSPKHEFPLLKEAGLSDIPSGNTVVQEYRGQAFLKMSGLDRSKLYDPAFFQYLIELSVRHSWDAEFKANQDNILHSIPEYFERKFETAFDEPLSFEKFPDLYVKNSHSGNCTFKCLLRAFHLHLSEILDNENSIQVQSGTDIYKTQKLLMQSQALVEICRKHLNKRKIHSLTPYSVGLIREIAGNLRDAKKKLETRGFFDKKFLDALTATLDDIDHCIQHWESKRSAAKTRGGNNLDKGDEVFKTPTLPSLVFPLPKLEGQDRPSKENTASRELSSIYDNLSAAQKTSLQECVDEIDNLYKQVSDPQSVLQSQLRSLPADEQAATAALIKENLFAILLKFPAVEENNTLAPFWSELNVTGCSIVMDTLYQAIRMIVTLESLAHGSKHDSSTTIIIYSCLALMDRLGRQLPAACLDHMPKVCSQTLWSEIRQPNFQIANEKFYRKLKEALHYFAPEELRKNYDAASEEWDLEVREWLHKADDHQEPVQRIARERSALFSLGLPTTKKGFPLYENSSIPVEGLVWWEGELTEMTLKDCPTFSYYSRFGQTEAEDNPMTALSRVAAVLEDNPLNPQLLPKEVHYLQQSTWLARLCLENRTADIPAQVLAKDAICFHAKLKNALPVQYTFDAMIGEYKISPHLGTYDETTGLKEAIRADKYAEEHQLDELIRREAPNDIIHTLKAVGDLSEEEVKRLRLSLCDAYDTLNRLLEFSSERLHLLKFDSYRDFVMREIKRPGRLQNCLKEVSGFGALLGEFFSNALTHYSKVGDWDTWIAVALCSEEVRAYTVQENFKGEFPKVRRQLITALKTKIEHPIDKLKAWQALMLFHRFAPVNTNRALAHLAEDYFCYKVQRNLLPYEETLFSAAVDAFEQSIHNRCSNYVQNLKTAPLVSLLNKILSQSIFDEVIGGWKGEYPVFSKGKYSINLQTGELFTSDGSTFSTLPEWVKKEKRFKEVTAGKYDSVKITEEGHYIISPSKVSVAITQTGIVYEKEIEGQKYRSVQPPYELVNKLPKYFHEEAVCWLHEGDDPHLMVQHHGKEQLRIKLKKYSVPSDCNPKMVAELEKQASDAWLEYSEDKNNIEKTAKWSKLKARSDSYKKILSTPEQELPYTIEKISRADGLVWVPGCPIPKLLRYIQAFGVSEKKIECWKTEDKSEVAEVNAESIGLKFSLKKKDGRYIIYSQNPHIGSLSSSQSVPYLKKNLKYFVFEDGKGNVTIKMPRVALTSKLAFLSDGQLDCIVAPSSQNYTHWVDLTYKNGRLTGERVENKLYALYVHLAQHDYAAAAQELSSIKPLKSFTAEEQQILNWSKQLLLANRPSHCHPSGLALSMRLMLLQRKNALLYNDDAYPVESIGTLKAIYKKYLEYLGNVGENRLSQEEELEFLKYLKETIDNEQNVKKTPTFSRLVDLIWGKINWKNSRSLTKYYHFNDFARRWEYLNGVSKKLGTFQSVKLSFLRDLFSLEKFSKISVSDLDKIFENQACKELNAKPWQFMSAVNDQEFKDNFIEIYSAIAEGSEEEKKKIHQYLSLNAHLRNNEEGSIHRDFLLRLLNKNAKLVPFSELKKIWLAQYKRNNPGKREDYLRQLEGIIRAGSTPYETLIYGMNVLKSLWEFVRAWFKAQWTNYNKLPAKNQSLTLAKKPIVWNTGALNTMEQAYQTYYDGLIKNYFQISNETKEVKEVQFPESEAGDDPALLAEIQRLNKELSAYQESQKKNQTFRVAEDKKIEELEAIFESDIKRLEGLIKAQASALLWQANTKTRGSEGGLINRLYGTGRRKSLNWNDLKFLFDRADSDLFKKMTYLDEQQSKSLMQGYANLLMHIRHLSKLKRCRSLLNDILQEEEHPDVKKVREHMLAHHMAAHCVFEHSMENRDLLLAEAAQGGLLRTILGDVDQYKLIREVEAKKDAKHVVIKAPTGSGKTKLLNAVLDRRKANNSGVANTFPESHEMVNTVDLQAQLSEFFSRDIFRLEFDAGKKITSRYLEAIYEEMVKKIQDKEPITFTAYSVQMLGLYWKLAIIKAGKKAPTAEEKAIIVALTKILRCFKKDIHWNCVDEPQTSTELDMVIISYGKGKELPEEHIQAMDAVFDTLLTEDMEALIGIRKNNHPLLSDDDYTLKIVPRIITDFSARLNISAENMSSFESYVKGEDDVPEWVNSHPKKESIHLLKGMIKQELPESFKGYVDEDYGLYKQHFSSTKSAGPYATSNTPKETLKGPAYYRNYHTTYLRSIISYLVNGLKKDQIVSTLQALQKQAEKDSTAGDIFKSWTGDAKLSLMTLSPQSMTELHAKLYRNPEVIRYYCKTIVGPKVKFFNKMVVSTLSEFRDMFAKTSSLSATPPPRPNFGPKAEIIEVEGAEGAVIYHLLLRDPEEAIIVVPNGAPREQLQTTAEMAKEGEKIRLVVDAGGQFRGLKGEEVADGLTKDPHPSVKTAVFFDEDSKCFHVKDVASGTVLEVREDILDPKQYLVYLDKARSYGSDMRLLLDSIALIWIGLKTTRQQAEQAYGRLWRNNIHLQKGYLLLPEAVAERVFGNPTNKSIIKLLSFIMKNQNTVESPLSYLAQKQMIDSALQRPLIDLMLGAKPDSLLSDDIEFDSEVDVSKAISLGKEYKSVLVKKAKWTAEGQYGKLMEKVPTLQELTTHKDESLKLLKSIKRVPEVIRNYIQKSINEIAESWKDPKVAQQFPKEVIKSQELAANIEVHEDFHQETHSVEQGTAQPKKFRRPATDWDAEFDYHTVGWENAVPLKGIAYRIKRYMMNKFETLLNTIDNFDNWLTLKASKGKYHKFVFTPLRILPISFYAVTMLGLISGQVISTVLGHKQFVATHLFHLSDILDEHLPNHLQPVAKHTNPRILVSNNFSRQSPLVWGERRQGLRDEEEKPPFRALVIYDELSLGRKKIQTLLLSPDDSEFWNRYLQRHQIQPGSTFKGRRLGLFDISRNTLTCSSKYPIPQDILLANTDFQSQIAEIKEHYGIRKRSSIDETHIQNYIEKVGKPIIEEYHNKIVNRNKN